MKSFVVLLGVEIRRVLRSPLSFLLLLLLTAGGVLGAYAEQETADSNLANVRNGLAHLTVEGCEKDAANAPADVNRARFLKQCLAELAMYRERYAEVEKSFVADADFAALGQHPVGALVWGVGLLASAPGFVALLLLAAHLVAGEWSRRTVTAVLLYEQRLGRLLAARAAAVWVWSCGSIVVISAGVWLMGVLHTRDAYPLDGPLSTDAVLAVVGQRLGAGLAVLAVAALLVVLLAALVRMPLRLVLCGVILLGLCAWSAYGPLAAWLPGRLLADSMDFVRHWATTDHWWVPSADADVPVWLRAVPTLAVTAAFFAWALRRRRRSLV